MEDAWGEIDDALGMICFDLICSFPRSTFLFTFSFAGDLNFDDDEWA